MKYFTGINNLKELRAKYFQLAKLHHPDKGGSKATMQAINTEYETALKSCLNGFTEERREYEIKIDPILRDKINLIIGIQNIVIEIIGSWLWISGETRPVKDDLKKYGFRYAFKKRAWSWHEGAYKKRSKRVLSLDEMRSFYGNKIVEKNESKQLYLFS